MASSRSFQALGAGSQDVYTAAIQYRAVGGGASKPAKVVLLAGVVGLLAVGLSQRRAGRPPTRKAPEREPAPVG